ncbi:hypothetical protein K2F54_16190 [Cryobacterium sp. 1639]|uniref:hypothetical protein n=1 Tax=Cryobacterium inferilacus TaxID=2866629 RepID=UPI001C73059F|nr:hypothetical protein [Cryobacterium sp. 1639]MBX0301514.1 hypothetical protein [Cryobacterium sp. 1639]
MKKPLVALAVLVLLTGCAAGAGTDPSPTGSAPAASEPASPSATPSAGQTASPPTDAQVTWAGTVCGDVSTLQTDVQGLATAAATGGDSVGTAVSDQMNTVSDSVAALVDTVKSPPENLGDDPELAAVQDSIDSVNQSLTALQTSAGRVEGTSGAARIDALATLVGDTSDVLTDLGATAQTISTAARDTSSTLGQAFRAAPECGTLTS